MSWADPFWFPHTISVRDHIGAGGMGARPSASRTVRAETIDERAEIRGADGREVVSTARVTVPLDQDVPLGSSVTIWPGGSAERTATVLKVDRTVNDPPLPSHLVLWLT